MNKFTKSLIATGLSVATVLPNTNMVSSAFVPTNYKDSKCIDIRKLGVDSNYIKKDKNVCGCKTCGFAAMTYDKISDYVSDLEKEFDVLSKKIYVPEVATKISIIESILDRLSDSITLDHYKNKNFLLVSANTLPRDLSTNVNFGKKDGIKYEDTYTKNYFNNLKETKVQPFLENVKAFRKNNEGKVDYNDLAGFFKGFLSLFGVASAILITVFIGGLSIYSAVKKPEILEGKINEITDFINKASPEAINLVKKNFPNTNALVEKKLK